MPFKSISELPDNIQKLPEPKQRQFLAVFNSAFEKAMKEKDDVKAAESSAFAQANAIIKATEMMFVQLSDSAATEIKLLYSGSFKHGAFGEFEVTKPDLEHAIKNFNDGIGVRGDSELPLNYNHASHDKNPDNAKAAGWIKQLFLKGAELWAKVDFTDKAKEFIKNKEFKYISPEFHKDWIDENGVKRGFTVLGAAVTNVNFLKKAMPALALTELENGDFLAFADLEDFLTRTPEKEALMHACSAIYPLKELAVNKIRQGEIKTSDQLKQFLINNSQDLNTEIDKRFREASDELGADAQQFTEPEKKNPVKKINSQNNGTKNGVETMELKDQLMQVLNLNDGDDVLKAVKNVTAKNAELENSNQDLETKVTKLTDDAGEAQGQVKELSEAVKELGNKIATADAEKVIEGFLFNETTRTGKILPKQKGYWIKRYLSDPKETTEYLESSSDAIEYTSEGSGSDGVNKEKDPGAEVDRLTKELMSKDKIEYGEAMNIVLTDNPVLAKEYNSADYFGNSGE